MGFLLLASLLFGEIKAPPTVTATVGRLVAVEVTTTAKKVYSLPPKPLDCKVILDGEKKSPDAPFVFWVVVYAPGNHLFRWQVAEGGEITTVETVVTVTGKAPDDPPTPPAPPVPPPDELAALFGGLYGGDQTPTKAADIALIREALGRAIEAARDPKILTLAGVEARYGEAMAKLPAQSLPALRDKLGELLSTSLPRTKLQPLTEELRNKLADTFGKLQKAMEGL